MKVNSTLGHTMKVGSLYELKSHTWELNTRERWRGKLALYLGESGLVRSDGVTVINHKFLVGSEVLLADRTFLNCLREIKNEN